MKISSLTIENFRLFKRLDIDFDPQLTVIVAKNGEGKTTILDAVYKAYPKYLSLYFRPIYNGVKSRTKFNAKFDQCPSKVNEKYTDKLRYLNTLTDSPFFIKILYEETSSDLCNITSTFFKGTEWEDIQFTDKLVVKHKTLGTLKVLELSQGIQRLFIFLTYIVFVSHNEITPNFNGVVLIDDIDLHLHPELQQTILRRFTETFPLIQFIVTTNSPIVLSTVRKENIRVISEVYDTLYGDLLQFKVNGVYKANIPEDT